MSKFLWKITLAATFGLALAFTISCTIEEPMCKEDVVCIKEPCDPIPVPCSTLRSGSSVKNQSSSSVKAKCGEYEYNPETYFCDIRTDQIYRFVKIGSQTWMAENLRFSETASDCIYYNDTFEIKDYCLYTYKNALCPDGWHLPSDEEWTQLTDFVGSDAATYGFTPIPIIPNDSIAGGWWSSTEVFYNCGKSTNCIEADPEAYIRRMSYDDIGVFKKEISAHDKSNAVRCVK